MCLETIVKPQHRYKMAESLVTDLDLLQLSARPALEWKSEPCSISQIIHTHQLPLLAQVIHGNYGENDAQTYSSGDIVKLDSLLPVDFIEASVVLACDDTNRDERVVRASFPSTLAIPTAMKSMTFEVVSGTPRFPDKVKKMKPKEKRMSIRSFRFRGKWTPRTEEKEPTRFYNVKSLAKHRPEFVMVVKQSPEMRKGTNLRMGQKLRVLDVPHVSFLKEKFLRCEVQDNNPVKPVVKLYLKWKGVFDICRDVRTYNLQKLVEKYFLPATVRIRDTTPCTVWLSTRTASQVKKIRTLDLHLRLEREVASFFIVGLIQGERGGRESFVIMSENSDVPFRLSSEMESKTAKYEAVLKSLGMVDRDIIPPETTFGEYGLPVFTILPRWELRRLESLKQKLKNGKGSTSGRSISSDIRPSVVKLPKTVITEKPELSKQRDVPLTRVKSGYLMLEPPPNEISERLSHSYLTDDDYITPMPGQHAKAPPTLLDNGVALVAEKDKKTYNSTFHIGAGEIGVVSVLDSNLSKSGSVILQEAGVCSATKDRHREETHEPVNNLYLELLEDDPHVLQNNQVDEGYGLTDSLPRETPPPRPDVTSKKHTKTPPVKSNSFCYNPNIGNRPLPDVPPSDAEASGGYKFKHGGSIRSTESVDSHCSTKSRDSAGSASTPQRKKGRRNSENDLSASSSSSSSLSKKEKLRPKVTSPPLPPRTPSMESLTKLTFKPIEKLIHDSCMSPALFKEKLEIFDKPGPTSQLDKKIASEKRKRRPTPKGPRPYSESCKHSNARREWRGRDNRSTSDHVKSAQLDQDAEMNENAEIREPTIHSPHMFQPVNETACVIPNTDKVFYINDDVDITTQIQAAMASSPLSTRNSSPSPAMTSSPLSAMTSSPLPTMTSTPTAKELAVRNICKRLKLPERTFNSVEEIPEDITSLSCGELSQAFRLLRMREGIVLLFAEHLVNGALLSSMDTGMLRNEFSLSDFELCKIKKFILGWRPL